MVVARRRPRSRRPGWSSPSASRLFGRRRSCAVAAWAVAGVALAIGMFGPVLDLPQVVLDLSPFGHVPKLPGGDVMAPRWSCSTAIGASPSSAGPAPFVAATSVEGPWRPRP